MNDDAGKKLLREMRKIIRAGNEARGEELQAYRLGIDLLVNEEIERAIAAFQQAIALQPDFAFSYYYLGRCFKRIEKYAEAINAFEKALRLNPLHASSRAYLGSVFLSVSKSAEAEKCFREALRLQFDNEIALRGLAEIARKNDSGFEEIAELLKNGYWRGRKNPLLLMELFSLQAPDADYCRQIADALVAQKSFHRAFFFYHLALRRNPESRAIRIKADEISKHLNRGKINN